jgi:hypothetical protein
VGEWGSGLWRRSRMMDVGGEKVLGATRIAGLYMMNNIRCLASIDVIYTVAVITPPLGQSK